MRTRGFTLLEMVAVIAVIAILTATAVGAGQAQQRRAENRAAEATLRSVEDRAAEAAAVRSPVVALRDAAEQVGSPPDGARVVVHTDDGRVSYLRDPRPCLTLYVTDDGSRGLIVPADCADGTPVDTPEQIPGRFDTTVLTPPEGLTAAADGTAVTLNWEPVTGARSYLVLRRDGDHWEHVATSATTRWETSRLRAGRTYTFAVVAATSWRESARSEPVTVETGTPEVTVTPPRRLRAQVTSTTVALRWEPSPSSTVISQRVWRAPCGPSAGADGSGCDTAAAEVVTVVSPATDRHVDPDVFAGPAAAYSYWVTAERDSGDPATSAAVVVTADGHVTPAPPGALVAEPAAGQITVSWDAPAGATDGWRYRVRRDGTVLTTVNHPVTSHTDGGVTAGTTHSYTVTTVDPHGIESAPAGPVTAAATSAPPAPPSSPTAVANPDMLTVTVSWVASPTSGVTYQVREQTTPKANTSATSWTDPSPGTPGTSLHYRVRAVDGDGLASPWVHAPSVVAPGVAPPGTPGPVSATVGVEQVTVSWTAPGSGGPPDGYLVERVRPAATSEDPCAGTSPVTFPTGPSVTQVTDTSAAAGTTYSYRVRASNAGGSSGWSGCVTATPAAPPPPSTPDNLSLHPQPGSAHATWTHPDLTDVDMFEVVATPPFWSGLPSRTVTTVNTAVTVHNLDPVSYDVQVRAVRDTVASAPAAGTVTPYQDGPLPAPTNLTADGGDSTVELSWQAPTSDVTVRYRLFRDGAPLAVTTAVNHTDSDVTWGQTYSYQVEAFDDFGRTSERAGPTVGTPDDLTPPDPPAGVSYLEAPDGFTVVIDPSPSDDVNHYVVQIASPPPLPLLPWPTTEHPTEQLTFTADGLDHGTTYRVSVVAVDHAGNISDPHAGAPDEVTAGVHTPPSPPAGLSGTWELDGGGDQMRLTWSHDGGVDHFTVHRDSVPVATVGPSAREWVDTDPALTPEATWTWEVRAVDQWDNTSAPASWTFEGAAPTSPPSAPHTVTAVPDGSQVRVSWQHDGAFVTTFTITRDHTAVTTVSGDVREWTDPDADPQSNYLYGITATNSAGSSDETFGVYGDLPPPQTFTAVGGDSTVELSWLPPDTPVDVTYRLFRDGTELTLTNPAGVSHVDPNVTFGTVYLYELEAHDTFGRVSQRTQVEGTPDDLTPPEPPGSPTYSEAPDGFTAAASPSPSGDVNHYLVRARHTISGETVDVTGPTSTVTVSGLEHGSWYEVEMFAVDHAGNISDPHPGAPDLVLAGVHSPPPPPPDLSGVWGSDAGDDWLTLFWVEPTHPHVNHYQISRDSVPVATVDAGETSWVDTDVVPWEPYQWQVRTVDPWGNTSTPVTWTWDGSGVTVDPPTGVTYGDAPDGFTVSFVPADEPNVDHHVIRVRHPDGPVNDHVSESSTLTVSGLEHGSWYEVEVFTVTTYGLWSSAHAGSPDPVLAGVHSIPAPAGLSGTWEPSATRPGEQQMRLVWSPPDHPWLTSITGYTVTRDGQPAADLPATVGGWVDNNPDVDPSGAHIWQVTVTDQWGNTSDAAAWQWTPPTSAPDAPTLTTLDHPDGVRLTWEQTGEQTVVGFRIWRDSSLTVELGAAARQWVDTDADTAGTYTYEIAAFNPAGESTRTVTVHGSPPGPPADLNASASGGLNPQVTLEWVAPAGTVDSYQIWRDDTPVTTVDGTQSSWTDTSVSTSTTYTYRVVATNAAGDSPDAQVTVTVPLL